MTKLFPKFWSLLVLTSVASINPPLGFADAAGHSHPAGGALGAAELAELEDAAQDFLEALSAEQRSDAQMAFDSPQRTGSNDASHTPSFCAVLAWCPPVGISQCALSYDQRVAMIDLLRVALSEHGHQTVQTISNRQALIGQLEDVADTSFVGDVAQSCPDVHATSIFDLPDNCPMGAQTAPDLVTVGGAKPPQDDGSYDLDWDFSAPPGLQGRYEEFCQYAISIFGEPGTLPWSIRFEGHHVSINVTVSANEDTGAAQINATPLFLGSFPVVVPPSPDMNDLTEIATWSQAQSLLKTPIEQAYALVQALPESVRQQARLEVDTTPLVAPLSSDAVPPWLTVTMLPDETAAPDRGALAVPGDALSDKILWHIEELYRVYFDVMPLPARNALVARLGASLAEGRDVRLLWDGKARGETIENVYLYLLVGDLELELLAGNQWSVQSKQTPVANHIHSMLRDRAFSWENGAPIHAHPHPH